MPEPDKGARNQFLIRTLKAEDAQAFFGLRLMALELSPEAFGSSAEEWQAAGPSHAEEHVADSQEADRFILGAFLGDELVGLLGMHRARERKARHIGIVWGVYVRPDQRGAGLAGRMLDEALLRARALPGLEQLQLSAGATNLAALRVYESRGFTVFGVERHALFVNGQYYDEKHLQLFLPAADSEKGV